MSKQDDVLTDREVAAAISGLELLISEFEDAIEEQHNAGNEGRASAIHRETAPARSALEKLKRARKKGSRR